MVSLPWDLVYLLGTGSRWQNNELRYSLRSVEKHLPPARIWILGERPGWLRGVEHIHCRDRFGARKLANAVDKLRVAVTSGRLPERWLLMNDDFFFLKPHAELSCLCRGTLNEQIIAHTTKGGYYYAALRSMRALLRARGIAEPIDYEMHHPLWLETERLGVMLNAFARQAETGYLYRSAYGNLHQVQATRSADFKLYYPWRRPGEGRAFLSTDNRVVCTAAFRDWIRQRFVAPSRWEG